MPISGFRGAGIGLPVLPPIGTTSSAISPSNLAANRFDMPAATTALLNAGNWLVGLGLYTSIEVLDPITGAWFPAAQATGQLHQVNSDGANYRIANRTGTVVGASITNRGTGYGTGIFVNGINTLTGAAGVTAAISSNTATFTVVVGGNINTTPTVVSGGTGYTYPPMAIISAPPKGGVPCTGYCTISSGVATLVIDNAGAGYVTAPTVTIVNNPLDTTGSGASFTLAIVSGDSAKISAVYVNNITNGAGAATSVPSITFSGGGGNSAAATAIMNFSVTAYAVTTAGSTYTGTPVVSSCAHLIAAQTAPVNPTFTTGLTVVRPCRIVSALSSGGLTATGQIVEDGGYGIQVAPTPIVTTNGTYATVANATVVTLTLGGNNDTVFLQSI